MCQDLLFLGQVNIRFEKSDRLVEVEKNLSYGNGFSCEKFQLELDLAYLRVCVWF